MTQANFDTILKAMNPYESPKSDVPKRNSIPPPVPLDMLPPPGRRRGRKWREGLHPVLQVVMTIIVIRIIAFIVQALFF